MVIFLAYLDNETLIKRLSLIPEWLKSFLAALVEGLRPGPPTFEEYSLIA